MSLLCILVALTGIIDSAFAQQAPPPPPPASATAPTVTAPPPPAAGNTAPPVVAEGVSETEAWKKCAPHAKKGGRIQVLGKWNQDALTCKVKLADGTDSTFGDLTGLQVVGTDIGVGCSDGKVLGRESGTCVSPYDAKVQSDELASRGAIGKVSNAIGKVKSELDELAGLLDVVEVDVPVLDDNGEQAFDKDGVPVTKKGITLVRLDNIDTRISDLDDRANIAGEALRQLGCTQTGHAIECPKYLTEHDIAEKLRPIVDKLATKSEVKTLKTESENRDRKIVINSKRLQMNQDLQAEHVASLAGFGASLGGGWGTLGDHSYVELIGGFEYSRPWFFVGSDVGLGGDPMSATATFLGDIVIGAQFDRGPANIRAGFVGGGQQLVPGLLNGTASGDWVGARYGAELSAAVLSESGVGARLVLKGGAFAGGHHNRYGEMSTKGVPGGFAEVGLRATFGQRRDRASSYELEDISVPDPE